MYKQDLRSVLVKAFTTLLPQPSSIDHLAKQDGWPVFAVSKLVVQNLHDGQASIQTDEVGQLERAHGNVGAVLHDSVNVLTLAHTSLEADDSLVDVRHQNAVGQEAGRVGADGGDLAHLLAELDRGGERGLRRLQAGDDLDALLHGHRVHEVGADDTGGGGEVRGVGGGGSGDLGDGDARGVCGEDGVRGADGGQLLKERELEVGDFLERLLVQAQMRSGRVAYRNRFNDHVDLRERIQAGVGAQPSTSSRRILLRYPLLGHVLLQELVGELETLVQ